VARSDESVATVIARMRTTGVSQLPVINGSGRPELIIHEMDILHALQAGTVELTTLAKSVAQPIGGLIYPQARIEELYRIFESDRVAVVVNEEKIVGVLNKIDLIDFMLEQRKKGH
jgi:cystathionine beta-synthase